MLRGWQTCFSEYHTRPNKKIGLKKSIAGNIDRLLYIWLINDKKHAAQAHDINTLPVLKNHFLLLPNTSFIQKYDFVPNDMINFNG